MSEFTKDLMRQLRFISSASNAFMSTRQKLTGQQRVLAILVKEDGLIQSQLAEILDIRPSSLAELMKKMEKSNDVLRKEEEHDKRIKRVFLTEKGRQKAKKISHVGEDMSEAFFAGLTEEEQENFSEYLQKISAGWQEEFQKQAGRFVDPMDRLRQMQAMREQFAENWQEDWQNLSREEQHRIRHQMQREMRNASREFSRNFNHDFRRNFWGNPDCYNGPDKTKDPENTEWDDF
ncbi:MarR family winged helix-turn-helix transcriptional regulator [Enterococcus avium]|uniref:MarR family winged helix-turn-helix transcriptional regulator n=1 Tax=Enterococcus avium TaxID=33945 RepID=A0ABD5FCX2_ENTAV|nr:MarR family winged helix-turn-helix transcriptional regulator [Enterococcus avium]MDB1750818.1 MarR family winged helix-turn-helix transcriptional regulator [Enterococcus avium]MDB1754918.1 MarR family winged helix-turn-helix transcriptional regulator [Enterococcus avium]MDB1762004.1 MarR family winged helix-turn-helix transcriptional regulator [Enterococcus avium]MDT2398031.1 MarR family winged helix-turn-helix transcriptional regulator [Enterococcus avium]MDT2434029.1 MarR family winged h